MRGRAAEHRLALRGKMTRAGVAGGRGGNSGPPPAKEGADPRLGRRVAHWAAGRGSRD